MIFFPFYTWIFWLTKLTAYVNIPPILCTNYMILIYKDPVFIIVTIYNHVYLQWKKYINHILNILLLAATII